MDIKHRYETLRTSRTGVRLRGEMCASLTIPSILPPEGTTEQQELNYPYQSLGAQGVNNLASKLLLTLVPHGGAFFTFAIDEAIKNRIAEAQDLDESIDTMLLSRQKTAAEEFDNLMLRSSLFLVLQTMLITGNVVLWIHDDGIPVVYDIDHYVCRRDRCGNIIELVLLDSQDISVLSSEVRDQIMAARQTTEDRDEYDLYTHVIRRDDKFVVQQYIEGIELWPAPKRYSIDESPFIVPRMSRVNGWNYARGYVEEYLGDLRTFDGLMQSLDEGAAASGKLLILVRPGAVITAKEVSKARSGDVLIGEGNDVNFLVANKGGDLAVVFQTTQSIEQRLAKAFLLNSSIQRSAERVTAEEIRYMAGELEDQLGGAYAILSEEFQKPLVRRIVSILQSQNKILPLPAGIDFKIITGFEVLGRGHELTRLDAFTQRCVPLDPNAEIVDRRELIARNAKALGIDQQGLVRTDEQIQAKHEEEQQAALATSALQSIQGGSPQ